MAADLPLTTTEHDTMNRGISVDIPTVLSCSICEVTWRDTPGAPCWFCGRAGHIANPERLVLD